MRIGASGLLAGMAALLLGMPRASAQEDAREPATSEEAEAQQEIVGDVLSVDGREVLVSVRGEPELRLQMRPRTVVLLDGQMGTVEDIREGNGIRALYRVVGDEPVAFVVEVTTQAQGK